MIKNLSKIILALVWICLIGLFFSYFYFNGIAFSEVYSHVSDILDNAVKSAGIWAPILFIVVYTIRPLIFFPATVLTTLAGVLFGPIFGILYTIIGENMSANLAFRVARFFKKEEYRTDWIKKIDKKASENGFITTLILRLIWAPFDGVNYGLGLTKMKQRDFFLGTFIGILPGLTIFVLFGSVLGAGGEMSSNMKWFIILFSAGLFVFSYYLSKYLKKKHNYLDVGSTDK